MGSVSSVNASANTGRTPARTESSYDSSTAYFFNPFRWSFRTYDTRSREPTVVPPEDGGDAEEDKPPEETTEEEQPVVKPEEPDEKKPAKPLEVKFIDMDVKSNTEKHRTNLYDITQPMTDEGERQSPQLVVRRGDTFNMKLVLNRKYEEKYDEVTVVFEIGTIPKVSKGTLQFLDTYKGIEPRKWGADVDKVNGNEITVRIQPAPDAIIGKWNVSLHTSFKGMPEEGRKVVNRKKHIHPVYMLFNPWCPQDQVYLEDDKLRDEYVLNDSGKIYSGNYKQISYKPWNFGQFEQNILDCAMFLLDSSGLKYSTRGDPVLIARKISAHVNSNDDNGILVGNWSGNYDGGTSPTAWGGSVEILEEFYETKRPVKYGQCWVFSGVVTTISRALGLPCRSVTNFASAHDTDGSITIDIHWNSQDEPIDELNEDSVWNFHVWNEAWMSRPDLPTGLGGWQAFDATPQELSDGVFCAGPASVRAIKEGNVNNKYDAHFIFAEVNADKIHWLQRDDGSIKRVVQSNTVGKKISTKWPRSVPKESPRRAFFDLYHKVSDDPDRHDVTNHYKFEEGSEEERAAILKANQHSTKPGVYKQGEEDVNFELHEKDHILVGNGFDIVLRVQNKSRHVRTVKGSITVNTVFYTGVTHSKVKKHDFECVLQAIKSDEIVCRVGMEEYLHLIVDQASFSVNVKAHVDETDQEYAEQDSFRLRRPDLELVAPERVTLGQTFNIEIKLSSPMPIHLTECKWHIEGPGLYRPKILPQKDLEPYDRVSITLPITPKKPGKKEIIANFDSKELRDVTGSCNVAVDEIE